jgi:hypothetical protein
MTLPRLQELPEKPLMLKFPDSVTAQARIMVVLAGYRAEAVSLARLNEDQFPALRTSYILRTSLQNGCNSLQI